ncbi:MAG: helix-turn-helix domain-containing protein [Lachnospiraceae bacterium]|nr:helix-turn-helix domain-containing protein [Lachnospiraceae bacterium]
MYRHKSKKDIRSPLESGLNVLSGKWKSRILCFLAINGSVRFSEIQKEMVSISDSVLSSELKKLIRDELVKRVQFDEIPPHVEYSLTEKGESVIPVLQSICRWSSTYYEYDKDSLILQCQRCSSVQKDKC